MTSAHVQTGAISTLRQRHFVHINLFVRAYLLACLHPVLVVAIMALTVSYAWHEQCNNASTTYRFLPLHPTLPTSTTCHPHPTPSERETTETPIKTQISNLAQTSLSKVWARRGTYLDFWSRFRSDQMEKRLFPCASTFPLDSVVAVGEEGQEDDHC